MQLSIVLSVQPAQFEAATFQGDLERSLASIASLGYGGVELAIRNPKTLDFTALGRAIVRQGLKVPAIGTGQAWGEEGLSFTDPDPGIRRAAVDRVLSYLPPAAGFGAAVIIGLIRGILKAGVEKPQALDWLVDALQECSLAAGRKGVRLALEPINRYETTLINNVAEGLDLIERVGVDNLGLLLDTFHMNIEESNIEAGIRAGGSRISHFHVADSNRWYPGAGHLDFRSILLELSRTGYSGWVSAEFLPRPDADTAAREGISCLRRVIA